MLLKISRELVESKVKAYSFKGLDTRNTNIAPSKMLPRGEFYRTALSDCIYHSVSQVWPFLDTLEVTLVTVLVCVPMC